MDCLGKLFRAIECWSKRRKSREKGFGVNALRRNIRPMLVRSLLFVCLLFIIHGCSPGVSIDNLKGTGLSFSCAAGDVTAREVIVWLRTAGPAAVSVHYGKEPGLSKFSTTRPVKTTKMADFTAKINISGLEPKTTYYYRGAVVGKKSGPLCKFVTAPRPDDPADVRFAFGGDTRESYQPFYIMDSIRAMKPDFFLFLGDTIYADWEGTASRLPEYWAKYVGNRSDLPTQRLFSETGLYVTWDDHEVENNYDPATPLAPIGRKAFFDYWPVRQDSQEPDRIYRSFRWGKAVELFILDTRQYRDIDKETMLGERQIQWLLKALSSSTALFKFIATSVPISGRAVDKWGGYPADQTKVLTHILTKRIRGVVFLSADKHYAAVSRIMGGIGIKEFIVGPLAARINEGARGTAKRFFFFSNESFSYGLVRVHANASPPYAEIDILDENNNLRYRTRIKYPTLAG